MSIDQTRPTHTSRAAGLALLCGLLALVLCLVPLVGVLAFPLGIAALIAGAVGIRRVQVRGSAGLGLALVGLGAGALALVVALTLFVTFLSGFQGPAWRGDWNDVRQLFQPEPS